MALKNTNTKSPVQYMLNEIQKALIRVGAVGMNYKFGSDGKIVGLSFGLMIKGNQVGFVIPVNIEKVKAVLRKDQNRRCDEDDYAYRVAWSYANAKGGKTVYDTVIDSDFLLDSGSSHA